MKNLNPFPFLNEKCRMGISGERVCRARAVITTMLTIILLTTVSISCQKEETSPGKQTGNLIVDIGVSISINEINNGLKATPEISSFKVTVYNSDGTEAVAFDSVSVMPDTIALEPGNYYVEAHSDNDLPAEFENPYYYGTSDVFSISSNVQQSVIVNCELANTIISVVYSDNIVNSFYDYSTIVFSSLDSLIFSREETRLGYFQTLPLEIRAGFNYLDPDGTERMKTLSGSIPEPLAGTHYEILIDASVDNGNVSFQFLMDESEIPIETVELNENDDIQPQNGFEYGELLITEIMYDPSALSDTEGEWFEIYNNSTRVINLQNMVIERNGTNRHTITDDIELAPGDFFVLARTETATDVTNAYIYGTDILLPNTGAELAIFNEEIESVPGTLIFSVNYGAENFPSATGASISLDPDQLNATNAILGTSWCTSVSVYNTGDSGTPGISNDLCQ